jgi:hypothetical protein
MSERRANQRSLCSEIVELFWSDGLGWPHRAKAILEDISPQGACLQTEAILPIHAEVALKLGEIGLPGAVRYCTLIGGSYFVGVEFAEGRGWSREQYGPEHLLSWLMWEHERATLNLSHLSHHANPAGRAVETGTAAASRG